MKKITKMILGIAMAAGIMSSCTKEPFTLTVSESTIEVAAVSAIKATVTITSNGAWKATSPEWVNVFPNEGVGDATVTVTFTDNSDNSVNPAREGKIVFGNAENPEFATVTVKQAGHIKPVTLAEWAFNTELMAGYTWDATNDQLKENGGTAGQFINANVNGKGKIEYFHRSSNDIDILGKKTTNVDTNTGFPKINGAWVGDYWLFTVNADETYPAGTEVSCYFAGLATASSLKYWIAEYLDGSEWKPLLETTTMVDDNMDKTQRADLVEEFDKNITYNVAFNADAATPVVVSATVAMQNDFKDLQVRLRCVSTTKANEANGYSSCPGGGAIRMVDMTSAGGSGPVFKVLK